ncbi:MAG TPA: Arc family DNA-binding protein [Fimbriimonas sp.]|nr:Arc family DNA-binding protein [Fimbriimonas sp.]
MAQVLVRQLPEETVQRLKERAKRNDRSLEHELREILKEAVLEPREELSQIRQAFGARRFSDSSDLIRER